MRDNYEMVKARKMHCRYSKVDSNECQFFADQSFRDQVDRYVVCQRPNDMSENTTLPRIYRNGGSPDQVSYTLSSTPFEYTILTPSQVLQGRGGDRKN